MSHYQGRRALRRCLNNKSKRRNDSRRREACSDAAVRSNSETSTATTLRAGQVRRGDRRCCGLADAGSAERHPLLAQIKRLPKFSGKSMHDPKSRRFRVTPVTGTSPSTPSAYPGGRYPTIISPIMSISR